MNINAYGERFSKPSRPILVYGAVVFFETASAEALMDQIANIGVHLYTSKNGLPDQRRESMWWRVVDLATSTSTTLRGTMFEFDPQVVDDEFFITVDGIPGYYAIKRMPEEMQTLGIQMALKARGDTF